MDPARVPVRGLVEVAGPEARALLQRLITNDVERLAPGEARYAALLSPQGKITFDFLVVSAPETDRPERFLLDCPANLAAALARKLTMYKLRAQVTVTDRSHELGAVPLLEDIGPADGKLLVYADPRNPALGSRAIGPLVSIDALRPAIADIDQRRVQAGIPEGGIDFAYDETFPHEANLDRLHGVDFTKGCYVGQEVVSRMQHRGTARKRVSAVTFDGPAPQPGTTIVDGQLPVGTMGSSTGNRGLALMRLDRAESAAELSANGVPIRLHEA